MSYSENVIFFSTVKSGLKKDRMPSSVYSRAPMELLSQMSDLELFWVCRVGWVTD